MYTRTTRNFANSWILLASGVLKCQDVGAHSRQLYRDRTSVDHELWKRAFHVFYLCDHLSRFYPIQFYEDSLIPSYQLAQVLAAHF